MKKQLFLFALLALACALSAYTLSVMVTITDNSPSVGSNVSLETSGVTIAAGQTGNDGIIRFNVSNGTYFAVLTSTIYPKQVSLVTVAGDTQVTLTKRQLISYATAYGEIFGPKDFSNATVTAYQGGVSQGKAAANAQGYYLLSYLSEGQYDLFFSVPGFGNATQSVYLPLSDFTEVNANVAKPAAPPVQPAVLSAPPSAQQYSIITVSLSMGGVPLSGQPISAATPSGTVELTTDSQGTARLNAAQGGQYTFTYGNASASTNVLSAQPAPAQPPAAPATAPEQPAQQPPQPAAGGSVILAAIGLFGILVIVGLLALLAWVKIVAPALAKEKRREGHQGHAEEPRHNAHETGVHKKAKRHGRK